MPEKRQGPRNRICTESMIKYFLFITGWLMCCSELYGQEDMGCNGSSIKKASKYYKKASSTKTSPEKHHYYKLAVKEDPEFADAFYKLAKMAMGRENYHSAKKYFLNILEVCPAYDVYVHYYLGQIYHSSEEYSQAVKHLKVFMKDPDKIKADRHYNTAESILEKASFYGGIYDNPVPFEPSNVKGICTSKDEYLPFITADNTIAYFTRRFQKKGMGELVPKQVEEFTFSKKSDGYFSRGEAMKAPFNMGSNEGGACLTIDNLYMYFTICKPLSNGYNNCDIYSAELVLLDDAAMMDMYFMTKELGVTEAELKYEIDQMKRRGEGYMWTNIQPISDQVNGLDTWESQPTVSSDNKTLYFTSNRKGGLGGLDIYKTVRDTSGEWSAPINLGEVINTAGNEKSPFIHPDKQTLYFSSDGHRGLGGFDIFISRLQKKRDKEKEQVEKTWLKPVNIGYPINGEDDDLGFFVSTDGKTGYFSSTNTSDRYRSMGGWDLYHFPLYEGARPEKVLFLKGDLKGDDGKPIENATMELTNVRTKEVTEVNVDAKMGQYAAVITLEEEDDYIMNVTKENYAFTSKYISTSEAVEQVEEGEQALDFDLEIKQVEIDEPYMIENIQFASNSSSVLTVESMLILDGFAKYLMANNEMEVAIYGHTDAVGSENDNLSLSEGRAKSVKDYLVLSGIGSSRLSFKGFGESRPIASNDNEEGMAKNRRTEFVITRF